MQWGARNAINGCLLAHWSLPAGPQRSACVRDPDAIHALVREDAVHRDVYIEPGDLRPGDVAAVAQHVALRRARQPDSRSGRLLLDRDRSAAGHHAPRFGGPGPRAHESLRAQGCTAGQRDARTLRGRVVALPLSRLDLSARRIDPHDPDAQRLRGHRARRSRPRAAGSSTCRTSRTTAVSCLRGWRRRASAFAIISAIR